MTPSQLKAHTRAFHRDAPSRSQLHNALAACRYLEVSTELPPPPQHIPLAYQGLAVVKTIRCSQCPNLYANRDVLRKHCANDHKGKKADIPTTALPKIPAQRWSAGKGAHSYFEVKEGADQPPTSMAALMDAFISHSAKATATAIFPDDSNRDVDPWLHFSKFLKHTKVHDLSLLLSLVAAPQEHETHLLQLDRAVRSYFAGALARIPSTMDLVLRVLHTPEPAR